MGPEEGPIGLPAVERKRYEEAAVQKKVLRGVILADEAKAFEVVSVEWIIKVLAAWGVPMWVIHLSTILLAGRRSTFRLGGKKGGISIRWWEWTWAPQLV